MMEIKHVMSQAAQDLDDGETRHESREAEAPKHEEVQWTKHASRSDSEAQQPDLTSRGGVLGECVYARCPHHKSTTTNTAQPHRVGALLPMPSCLGIGGHQWVPARTPTVQWGPNNGEAVGGPHQHPKGEVHMP